MYSDSRAVHAHDSTVNEHEAVRLTCLSYCVLSEESGVSFFRCTSQVLETPVLVRGVLPLPPEHRDAHKNRGSLRAAPRPPAPAGGPAGGRPPDGSHPTAAGALWKERLREGLLRSEPEQTGGAVAGMRPLSPSSLWAAFHAGPGAAMDFTLFSLLLSFFNR